MIHINPLIAGVGRRFRKSRFVDVVGRPPGKIRPMRAGLKDIVLKIMLMQQNQTLLVTAFSKLV
jgi:hypothetical protein